MQQELNVLAHRAKGYEADLVEHQLVIESMEKFSPDCRAFRQVGEILVERTVGEIIPAVQKSKKSLMQVTKSLKTEITNRNKDIEAYKETHKLMIVGLHFLIIVHIS